MFNSIQYKYYAYTFLLVLTVAGTTWAVLTQSYFFAILGITGIVLCISGLNGCYRRYSNNMIFLLNALENGDYAFHFSEAKLSAREREMAAVMNRIKDILANARKEVIENEHFLSLILESVSTGIIIIDDKGIVQKVNQPALEMLGLSVFSHVNQLHTVNESYPEQFHRLKAGDSMQLSLTTEREELQISLHVSQIRMKRGMMRILTLNNIGNELEMKEMESWIRLIRVMTHEIMNSIAPITSLSETMRFLYQNENDMQELRQNTLEAFETINSTASGLLSFVESYRKFTAVPKPKKSTFDLKTRVEKVIKLHEQVFLEKGITWTIQIPDSLTVCADESLITQVLINLIKNAIEAVEPHAGEKIMISAQALESGKIGIEIADTGRPIPPDVLSHIFVPFFTTKSSGSGIGLSLSRYIMRLHGGKLQHATSKEGLTIFTLVI